MTAVGVAATALHRAREYAVTLDAGTASRVDRVQVDLTVRTPTEEAAGPAPTHVPLDPETGLSGYDVSYANATDLHSIHRSRLRRRRGRLHPAEMWRLEGATRTYLGL